MRDIDVCVTTYKRPELLSELLRSLLTQNLDDIRMRIIIVDNDSKESARSVVEKVRSTSAVEIVYDVEPCQSISLARNKALRHISSDYFAFVDDDETVPSDWLTTMLSAMQYYNADVILGPVVSLFSSNSPQLAKVIPLYNRPRYTTGTQLKYGGSGNVLVRRGVLGQPPLQFDPTYGLSGGEDTDFFYRLHLSGRQLFWCDEAVVNEHVPASRLTIKWLQQRGFRGGQSFARIFVRRYSLEKKAAWLVKKILQLVGGIIAAPFVRFFSYPTYVRLTVRIMAALGQLSVAFSNTVYEEYRAGRQ